MSTPQSAAPTAPECMTDPKDVPIRDLAQGMLDAIKRDITLAWIVVDPTFEPLVVALAAEIDRPIDQQFFFEIRSALDSLIRHGDRFDGREIAAMGNRADLYEWVAACPDRLRAVDRAMRRAPYSDLKDAIHTAQVEEIAQIARLIAEAPVRRRELVAAGA